MLAFQKVSIDHSRKSALQWIEDMTIEAIEKLPHIGSSTAIRPMTNLRGLIGLAPGVVAKPNQYRLELDLKHKGGKLWKDLMPLRAELYDGTELAGTIGY